uniref:Uncharacterized protein n=1 Tax=Magallana gigas TaxID=29159 RepID=K1RTS4_MAGGI
MISTEYKQGVSPQLTTMHHDLNTNIQNGIRYSHGLNKCRYEENDIFQEADIDPATQICCPKAGVRERFELGQEMDCCGEIAKKTMRNRTHICCKSSGIHERYQEEEEVDCCADGVYKRQTEQCLEKITFQKDVKTTCGNSRRVKKNRIKIRLTWSIPLTPFPKKYFA